MNASQLFAAAAQIEITPPVGAPLAGSLEGIISDSVTDELHARIVLLESASTRIAFVLLDLIGISNDDAARASQLIGDAAKLPPENICLSCTHTHFAPCLLTLFNSERNEEYAETLLPKLEKLAHEAAENMQPARAAWGIGHEATSGFNRRYHMKSGGVTMNPGDPADILRPAGPTDPQVPMLFIETQGGAPLAVVANFSQHYIGDQNPTGICADYFGLFAEQLKAKYGDGCQALLTHGFSGDINSINFIGGEEELPPREKSRRLAALLAQEAETVRAAATFHDEVFLASTRETVNIGVRKISGEAIEKETRKADDETLSVARRAYGRERLALLEWPDEFPATIQAIRVGDYAAVAMPGEMFCRFGLDVKNASPFPVTATMDLSHGFCGYVPTITDYPLGGYETWLARSAFAAPGSGEKMVEVAARLLQNVAAQFPVGDR